MRVSVRFSAFFVIMTVLLAACAGNPNTGQSGPRLVQDNTLEPIDESLLPTRVMSPTPEFTPVPDDAEDRDADAPAAIPPDSGEVVSPLQQVTVEADFVLVTPTLPPSKTPTQTPTFTQTPTITPTPSVTATATATMPVFPTSIIMPVTAPVAQPIPQICDSTWFFIEPRPASCPLNPPLADQGVYQEFQNGFMVWVRPQNAIYVMYNDQQNPRWQVFRDGFEEGMPEFDGAYINSPHPNTWQPRRGFGLLWRNNQAIRDRIGWATQEWEQPFSVQTQTASDGSIFISTPNQSVFGLLSGGRDWTLYRSYAGF